MSVEAQVPAFTHIPESNHATTGEPHAVSAHPKARILIANHSGIAIGKLLTANTSGKFDAPISQE